MVKATSCPACRGDLPAKSRFCPHCGAALGPSGTVEMITRRPSPGPGELPASQPGPCRLTIHDAHRRPLGAPPVTFLAFTVLFVLMVVLIFVLTGWWIGAIIALGVCIGVVTLFLTAARHDPDSRAARVTSRALINVTSMARFLALAMRAWTQAAVALLRIRHRRLRLNGELQGHLTPLGEAVYRDRQEPPEELELRAAALGQLLRQMDHQESAIIEGAREEIERQKATTQATRTMPRIPQR